MAHEVRPARTPLGQDLDCNQPTDCDGQTKKRKCKPLKGNDKISSKSQKTTKGGTRMPSDRSARDFVQACGQTCDLSKSVPRKELTMADGSSADTSSKFSKESSSSLSSTKMKRVTKLLPQKIAKPKTFLVLRLILRDAMNLTLIISYLTKMLPKLYNKDIL
jgi:hypothetical protein